MADVETKKDEDYDDDSLSSSDSDDDTGPPPMIQIERSADLGALKSALFEAKDKQEKQPKEIEERLGKEALSNITSAFEKPRERSPKAEKEKIVVDREQYSSFKQKFEHLDEELAKKEEERRAAQGVEEIEGIGAEILKEAKAMFEQGRKENGGAKTPNAIEIERSDADRKRVKETFFEASETKEEPRDCAVCGKMVYPVEKVLAEKRVFHKACFKCTTCQKTLSVQGYSSHEGKLYCKLHIMEIYRPEVGLAHEGALEADTEEPDDEEEYAVVAKPKMLDPSVVRSGLKTTDDLENVPKLQNVKAKWAESAEQASKVEKRSGVEEDLIQQGKVKSRLTKFIEGGDNGEAEPEEDEDDATRDPNIIRSTKKKEAIHVEVGAKSIKSKWDTGAIERAQGELQDRSQELDEIKKNVSVKERFKERTGDEEVDPAQRRSILDEEQLDTSFTKSAKERFRKGEAFEEHATEKTAVDVRCAELGNIKAAFEQSKGDDQAVTDAKRQQIQDEFTRIKTERLAMQEKEKLEGGDAVDSEGQKNPEDVRQSADMGSIKKRFEEGTAFQTGSEKKSGEQLEIKVAGKAREKFKQIDQEAPKEPVINQSTSKQESKWAAKDKGPAPEAINRRVQEDSGDEEPEEYDVKSLLNKFKNVEQGAGRPDEHKDRAAAEELAAIKVEARNLKDKFEKVAQDAPEGETAEEKRKRLEEEFKRIKELKESQQPEEPEPEESKEEANPDLAIAAEHAAKAKAKWDKIQRKEAKKAEKAAALASKGAKPAKSLHLIACTPAAVLCVVCTSKVYQMEKLECDGRFYHRPCFRCAECGLVLRLENYASAPNGCVYCRNHYKILFNNMSRPLYDGRQQRVIVPVN